MKKHKFGAVIGCISAVALLSVVLYMAFNWQEYVEPEYITHAEFEVYDDGAHPANQHQNAASVVLAANGRLYFQPIKPESTKWKTKYYDHISVFGQGTAKRLVDSYWNYGSSDGYMYYIVRGDSKEEQYTICCYDLSKDVEIFLFSTNRVSLDRAFFAEDGSLCCPAGLDTGQYHVVRRSEYIGLSSVKKTYQLNGRMYTIKSTFGRLDFITCEDSDGNVFPVDEIPEGFLSIIPCEDGFLVHNEGFGNLLYFIEEETGNIVELFSVPCIHSVSAVNVHDNQVYFSFMRYEKSGDLGLLRYEDDHLEGTYRINLDDYSVEKISNEIYNGIYIFDDTGMYVCDSYCNIYKLDFDGQIIMTLMEN